MRRLFTARGAAFVVTALVLSLLATGARAGLDGQPQPSADTVARLRAAVRQFLIGGGDLGKARPDLILLIEREPTADYTDLLMPALRDSVAYQGISVTLEEALEKETDPAKKNYLAYNLARLHLLRSRFYDVSTQKRPFLDVAAKVADLIPKTLRDNAAYELKGDIELDRGDTNAAMASYGRIKGPGGNVLSQYKMGQAYQRLNRYREAEAAYNAALKADAASSQGQSQLYHDLWQSLGGLYLVQRRDADAVNALGRSARVRASEGGAVRFQVNLARALLARGFRREVTDYAQTTLKLSPEDPQLTRFAAELKEGL